MNPENVVDTNTVKKYEQLQKRVQEMEQNKSDIHSKLLKAQKHVKRLRMERLILLEQLDEYYTPRKRLLDTSDTDGSGDESLPYEVCLKQLKRRRNHLDKSILSNKKLSSSKLQETPARKKKDPMAPKGPGNVFFLYCRMEREHFKDELPTENLGEVTRLLGQRWKAMTDDEKKKYYDIYDKEQEEYQKAMKSYKEAGGGDAGRTAVSELNNVTTKHYNEMDIMQDDLDVHNGNIDDEEGSGLFMDEIRTTTTNVPTAIGDSITLGADSAPQWYG